MVRTAKQLIFATIAVAASITVSGQSVYLKVLPSESTRSDNYTYRSTYSGSFEKNVERSEAIKISVKNMYAGPADYVVEWMFLAAPAQGGGTAEPYHSDELQVSMQSGGSTNFEVRSPKLASTHSHYSYSGTYMTGQKFAGYVVRAKFGDKILAVEATDTPLRNKYQNPKAPWGVTEPKPFPTTRPGRSNRQPSR